MPKLKYSTITVPFAMRELGREFHELWISKFVFQREESLILLPRCDTPQNEKIS
jgi:hypothetical protein